MTTLSEQERTLIRQEINAWQREGIISPAFAARLQERYRSDLAPAPLPPAQNAPPPAPASPPPPRPNLLQTLTSEASVKIALYLGAFFVIAAALILAALVAILRLPILAGAAISFGATALFLKKRLPQPSFILWLVGSALALISAGVFADLIGAVNRAETAYWSFILLLASVGWAFSAWFYRSRLFALAAFGAFTLSSWFAADIFNPEADFYLFTLSAAGIAGLAWAWALRRILGDSFYKPVFFAVQTYQFFTVTAFLLTLTAALFAKDSQAWWLFSAFSTLNFALFYLLSDFLSPFAPFRFLSAAALTPTLWLALRETALPATGFALAWTGWGTLLALSAEILRRIKLPRLSGYVTPLTLGAVYALFSGAILAIVEKETVLQVGLFAVAGSLLLALHLVQRRWWVWLFSLAALLGAYFSVWELPALQQWDWNGFYPMLAVCAALSLFDWLLPGDGKAHPAWRSPLRFWLSVLGAVLSLGALMEGVQDPTLGAHILGGLALLGGVSALRFQSPRMGILLTGYTPLTVLYALRANGQADAWLPVLAGLAAAYYLTGFALARFKPQGWSLLLRRSGLSLVAVLLFAALLEERAWAGWIAGAGLLFFVMEAFGHSPWLELALYPLAWLALGLILRGSDAFGAQTLTGISVLTLGTETLFAKLSRSPRPWAAILLFLSGLLTFGSVALILATQESLSRALLFGLLAASFWGVAHLRRAPKVGYLWFFFLAFTLFFGLDAAGQEKWLAPFTALFLAVYALAWLPFPSGWEKIRRFSGLALATLTALSAPLENSGLAGSVPVSMAATLWAVEAFRRRNVWLGFPANALYLMAYFMILLTLEVKEPQFYSVGAAVLGMLMHYLLLRTGSKAGAFFTGMASQLVLLSTTYIQMAANNDLAFFAALFLQSLVVLVYGLVIRSRSLVFTPLLFVVLGVVTVVFSVLKGIATVLLIGCTGVLFLLLGIVAIVLRERLANLRQKLSDWQA